mmetsp:Transcript_8637/g.14615  ORF Transcript_8637/g.14615 Transcript_8637/m.14615 type:complete len:125 (+) Transcript_8637:739-1113(+)
MTKVEGLADKKDQLESKKVVHPGNPHLNCIFVKEDTIVACGYDKVPYVYKNQGGEWKETEVLDKGIQNPRKAKITGNSFLDKKYHFNPDLKLGANVEMVEKDTKHSNYINYIKPFAMDHASRQV